MTGPILKRRAGRPPLPPAPQNAAETRSLIASETVKANPRERTLRQLYRLLRTFVAAEDAARTDAKTKALDEANRLKQSEIDLRRAEYQRRFDLGPLGVKVMRQRIAELEEKAAEIEAKKPCMSVNSGVLPTLTVELRWTRDGRVHREQFTGRSPEETQRHIDQRIDQLRKETNLCLVK